MRASSTTKCARPDLTITPDARALLLSLLGGDRMASRNEMQKLALYAHGQTSVDVDDVMAVASDAGAIELSTDRRCWLSPASPTT